MSDANADRPDWLADRPDHVPDRPDHVTDRPEPIADRAESAASRRTPARPAPLTFRRRPVYRVVQYCTLLGLSLGLGAGALTARVVWEYQESPEPTYATEAALRVNWTAPRMAELVAQTDPVDGTTRSSVLRTLLTSDQVLPRALGTTAVAALPAVRHDLLAVRRLVIEGLEVQCDRSEVAHLRLSGSHAEMLPAVLNAIKDVFLKEFVEEDRAARKARLVELDERYQQLQKNLLKDRRELIAAALDADSAAVSTEEREAASRLEEAQRQLALAEADVVRLRALVGDREKKKPRMPPADPVPDLVKQEAEREPSVRAARQNADRILTHIRAIERVSARPSTLDEYRQAVTDHKAALKAIEERKAALRPGLEKAIRARLEELKEAEETDDPEEGLEQRLAEVRKLTELVKKQAKAVLELAGARQQRLGRQVQVRENKKTRVEELQRSAQAVFEQAEVVRNELNRPLAATPLEDAEAVTVVSMPTLSGPRWRAALTGFGVFGGVFALLAWRELRQLRVRAPEDLLYELGTQVLGVFPALTPARRRDPALQADHDGAVTESIDALAAVLAHRPRGKRGRVLMVTSAVGHEGKTTLAAHLAASLARAGRRTLLVDGDLVHPAAHALFEEPLEPGLSDLLRGQAGLPDVIRPTAAAGLWLVPAGHADAQVVQALARDAAQPLLERLRAEYDVIVVDSSPVLPLAHSLLLGKHVDAAVLTVRKDVSRILPVYAAHQRLLRYGVAVMGLVFVGDQVAGLRRTRRLLKKLRARTEEAGLPDEVRLLFPQSRSRRRRAA